jgi:two-component system copper resistance phosphate regulon response regulator CusR
MMNVLIAEDEPLIAAFIERGLRANGYLTRITHDAREARELAASGEFDVLILDARLAASDGPLPAEPMGPEHDLPTLLLVSGHATPREAATSDRNPPDTLTKPFGFAELLDHVRSLLHEEGIAEPTLLRAGGATLDTRTRQLTVSGDTFRLDNGEFALAEALFRTAGRDLSISELLEHADRDIQRRPAGLIEAELRRLREKLGSELMTSVVLTGYRLRGSDIPGPATPFAQPGSTTNKRGLGQRGRRGARGRGRDGVYDRV